VRTLFRWLRHGVFALVVVWATLVVGGAFGARARLPELKPWHLYVPPAEITSADVTEKTALADLLKKESDAMAEVRSAVEDRLSSEDRGAANRYDPKSPLNPDRAPTNWNRTFELAPGKIRGGVLLVHGLTDAPYSVKALAELYRDHGFHALALRMPGHGTVPGALTRTRWEDWMAAVRVGARHVRAKAGEGAPFHVVGYSNGGALVLSAALESLDDKALPKPDRIVLVSPMIGVTPLAALARTISRLGAFPYFEKAKWTDVLPEFNPYKYNSFPANAGFQTWELTRRVQQQVKRLADAGRAGEIPKILTFSSLLDATVSTPATIEKLYGPLAENGSELVLFDANRMANVKSFLEPGSAALLSRAIADRSRRYLLTVVTNAGPEAREVVTASYPPGATEPRIEPAGLAWPAEVYSLSHIALPFRPDDPLFGLEPPSESRVLDLGRLAPRGEKSALTVPESLWLRLASNPFFAVVETKVAAAIDAPK
jgi:alpha-beta hydrolase superfamily lysophospholipase